MLGRLAVELIAVRLRHLSTKIAALAVGILRVLLISAPLALFTAAAAQEPIALSADIPAQPLAEALMAFSRQTDLNVAYVSGVIHGERSHAVPAGLGATAALARLLEGTGLRFEFLTTHSVRIFAAAPAPAPQSPPASVPQSPVPEVLVTGSRIPVPPNITATSPMQVITAQDIVLSGHMDTVDVISALPQMTVSAGADFGNYSSPANSAGGFSTADLRGLGPQRTVVLINGRRLGLGDPNTANRTPAPDLDQVPLAMVERVEVLTGGASATYGSDAIAGVVNFILKDRLQGVQIDAQYGFAQHTQQNDYLQALETAAGIPAPSGTRIDGSRRAVSVLAGTDFADGRGNVTGYFVYQAQNPVYASARDFSACSAVSTNALVGVPTQGGVTCVLTPESNLFVTQDGASYSVVGDRFVPWPAAGSVPPPRFNPEAHRNFFDSAAVNNALQVTTDPAGHPVCISGGSCVPYDLFTTGAVMAPQLAYLYALGTEDGANSEQIFEADVTGQLGRYGLSAPWAHEGMALNAGVEHRTETLQFAPDATELTGSLAGHGVAPVAIDQRVSVNEAFVEVRVPLAQDRPLLKDLTVGSGYRYSLYSTAGATNTYRFDLQFAPTQDVRLRTSYDRVVRAPNLIELYTPLSYAPSPAIDVDPCAPTDGGATHAAASLAACMHTGVSATQYGTGLGPAFGGTSTIVQCSVGCGVVTGGNQALQPETADTWSLGLTATPAAIPTLTASVDYFRIRLTGEIGTVPEAVTLQRCLDTGDPAVCSQIVRTVAGSLRGATVAGGGYILQTAVNTGSALVSGIDVQANYRLLLGRWGALAASLNGSWLQHSSSTPYRSAPSYDCAGLFGNTCLNGSVNPRWRHNMRLTWEMPWSAQLSAQWRFIGGTEFDNNSRQLLLQNQEEGFFDPVLTHIASYSYLDVSAIWVVSGHVQVDLAVNNVFDKDPPLIPLDASSQAGNLNTFPTYDILGRTVLISVHAKF